MPHNRAFQTFLTVLCCSVILSLTTNILTRAEGVKEQSYLFFPYESCIQFTVQSVDEPSASHKPYFDRCVMNVRIDEVLRGDFKVGQNVKLAFEEPLKFVFPSKRESVVGSSGVLAFNAFSLNEGVLPIYNLYSPFNDQRFSRVDILSLKEKLQPLSFSEYNCVLVTVKEVRPDKNDPHSLEVRARVDEALYGKIKTELKSNQLVNSQNDDVIFVFRPTPELLPSKVEGTQCVWSFNDHHFDGGKYHLYEPRAPFPSQKFTAADLKSLRAKFPAATRRHTEVRLAVEEYLKNRWTRSRIKDFCRPENRIHSFPQNLVPHSTLTLHGKLYPELEDEVGIISWYCDVNDDIPHAFSLCATRKTRKPGRKYADCWFIELGYPTLKSFTDDDFLTYRIARTLYWATWAYDIVHKLDGSSSLNAKWSNHAEFDPRFSRSDLSKLTSVTFKLKDRQKLKVCLNDSLEISNIQIDGRDSSDWMRALAESERNIDAINIKYEKAERGNGTVKF